MNYPYTKIANMIHPRIIKHLNRCLRKNVYILHSKTFLVKTLQYMSARSVYYFKRPLEKVSLPPGTFLLVFLFCNNTWPINYIISYATLFLAILFSNYRASHSGNGPLHLGKNKS